MSKSNNNPIGLISGSTLKIIGCILMIVDHVGCILFPRIMFFRIVGRLAMPIFAFLIAEGCYYTKNKLKHFLLIFISGMIFLIGVWIFSGMWYFNIFIQFSISVLYIYLIQYLQKFISSKDNKIFKTIISIIIFSISLMIGYYLFKFIPFEYGFFTTLLPVFVSMLYIKKYSESKIIKYIDNHFTKVFITFIFLILIYIEFRISIQIYSLLSIPILLLYNGEAGCKKMKYFFYLFYPAHIIIIFLIRMLLIK